MLEAKAKYNATKAIALIIEPGTGSLIAMTGVPKRQPHAEVPGAFESRNMAVTDIYEPGSTMKIMTVAAALEAGAITSKSTLFLNSGYYYDKEHKFELTDHHPMEWAPIMDIMKHSSNIGAFKIAQKLGKERFYTALHQFGLGQKTDLHLPREAKGLLKPGDTWKGPTLSRIAMGYQVSVTPLQLIMAVGAIANQGHLMKPRLIDRTISADGLTETVTPISKVRDVCSPRVASIVTEMLEAVVNDGTGDQAAIPDVRVAGKTGTAKLYDPKAPGTLKYREGHYIVSFVGFAPVENPQLACLIILEDPKVDDQSLLYGGKLAAPIFSKVMTTALKYHQAASTRRPKITVVHEGGAR
jgi:cell division protein FtsI/penicillin-binding protein 2